LRELQPLLEDRRLALGTIHARSEILEQLTDQRGLAEFGLPELRRRLADKRNPRADGQKSDEGKSSDK